MPENGTVFGSNEGNGQRVGGTKLVHEASLAVGRKRGNKQRVDGGGMFGALALNVVHNYSLQDVRSDA